MKGTVVQKIIWFGMFLLGIFLFSSKAGLDTAVSIISFGVIGWFLFFGIPEEIFADKDLQRFFLTSAVFLFLGLLSIVGAVDKFSAWKRLVTILGYYGLLLGVCLLKEEKTLRQILIILVGVVILEAIFGALQVLAHRDILGRPFTESVRACGTLSYPNDLGFALGVFLPFLFALFLGEKDFSRRIFYLGGFLFGLLGLILTFTRGAWLGTALALFLVATLKNKKLLLWLVLLGLLPLFFSPVRQRLQSTSLKSEYSRQYIWKHTPELIKQKLFLGWGLDNFKPVFFKKYPDLPESEKGHFHPHNLYLNIAFQTGIFGLATFLLMFFFLFKFLISQFRQKTAAAVVSLGAIGSLVDFLVHGLVDEPWRAYQAPEVLFFVIGVAIWYSLRYRQEKSPFADQRKNCLL